MKKTSLVPLLLPNYCLIFDIELTNFFHFCYHFGFFFPCFFLFYPPVIMLSAKFQLEIKITKDIYKCLWYHSLLRLFIPNHYLFLVIKDEVAANGNNSKNKEIGHEVRRFRILHTTIHVVIVRLLWINGFGMLFDDIFIWLNLLINFFRFNDIWFCGNFLCCLLK